MQPHQIYGLCTNLIVAVARQANELPRVGKWPEQLHQIHRANAYFRFGVWIVDDRGQLTIPGLTQAVFDFGTALPCPGAVELRLTQRDFDSLTQVGHRRWNLSVPDNAINSTLRA